MTDADRAYRRFVAIGDSWTEGVGDPDRTRPNGLRGWADRVAEVLAARSDDFGYANFAVRGRRVDELLDEQLAPALALGPDLLTIQGGGNDFLRASVDIDVLVEAIDRAVARSVRAGAEVVLFTHGAAASGPFRALRGRIAIFNELSARWPTSTAPCSSTTGGCGRRATLATGTPTGCTSPPRATTEPRCTCSTPSASTTGSQPHPLSEVAPPSGRDRLLEELAWVRSFAGPWACRRLVRRSTGAGISAKRPTLSRI